MSAISARMIVTGASFEVAKTHYCSSRSNGFALLSCADLEHSMKPVQGHSLPETGRPR
jgi:hypothetical protein